MIINTYPHPTDLRYFQEVAYTLNLSRAAERLGVGQPALSLSLKRLEEVLGQTLFYRRSKGLSLTPAGVRLQKECNKLLADWESLIAQTKKSETDMVGRYSLGCHQSVALYTLPGVLKEIYSTHEGLELQLQHDLSRIVCERVISGDLDFGYVVNPVKHPDLIIHKLATDEVGFWKSKNGVADVLICDPALRQTQDLLLKSKKKPFSRTIGSGSLEVIAALAAQGAGTAILPGRVVKALAPQLVLVEGMPSYKDEITFVYRSDLIKTASSRYLLEKFKGIKI